MEVVMAVHKCPQCGFTAKNSAGLGSHMKNKHGVAGTKSHPAKPKVAGVAKAPTLLKITGLLPRQMKKIMKMGFAHFCLNCGNPFETKVRACPKCGINMDGANNLVLGYATEEVVNGR